MAFLYRLYRPRGGRCSFMVLTMMEHGARSLLIGWARRSESSTTLQTDSSFPSKTLIFLHILPFVFVSYLPGASRAASFDSLAAACNSTLFHEVKVVPLRSSLRYFSIRRSFS